MKSIGFIYAISAAVTWGLIYTADQRLLTKVSPIPLLFISSLLTVIMTLPILFTDTRPMNTLLHSGKTNLGLIVIVALLATLANFFILSGIQILGASTASIFEIAYPFFVVLFSFLFFQTNVNIYFLLGSILIFLGSFIIIRLG